MPAETLRQAQDRCSWRAETAKRIPSPIRGLHGETRLSTGSIFTDQLFTGQREMTGLGIYHFNARFYSPKLGRFLSADTIVPNVANPQDLNRFSYVGNNPLRYTDPTGNRTCGDGEKYDCDGKLNPTTPSKPPVVIVPNPKPKKDKDPDQNPSGAPGGVVIPIVETESPNPPVIGLVVIGLLLHTAIVISELGLIAGEVVLAPMIAANPLVVVPLELTLMATSVALLDLDVAYWSYTYQVYTNPGEEQKFEILPPWGFDK